MAAGSIADPPSRVQTSQQSAAPASSPGSLSSLCRQPSIDGAALISRSLHDECVSKRLFKRIFLRFTELSGIVLSARCEAQWSESKSAKYELTHLVEDSDVLDLRERVKQMNIVPYAEGTALFIRALNQHKSDGKHTRRVTGFKERARQLTAARSSDSNPPPSMKIRRAMSVQSPVRVEREHGSTDILEGAPAGDSRVHKAAAFPSQIDKPFASGTSTANSWADAAKGGPAAVDHDQPRFARLPSDSHASQAAVDKSVEEANEEVSLVRHLADMSLAKFCEALRYNLDDYLVLCNYSFLLSSLYQRSGDTVTALQRALHANPLHVRSWYYMGLEMAYLYKRHSDARLCFEKAIVHSEGTHANALKDYANLLWYTFHDLQGAQRFYLQALSVRPDHTRSLINLAGLLNRTAGDWTQFEQVYTLLKRAALSSYGDLDSKHAALVRYLQYSRIWARCVHKRALRGLSDHVHASQVLLEPLSIYREALVIALSRADGAFLAFEVACDYSALVAASGWSTQPQSDRNAPSAVPSPSLATFALEAYACLLHAVLSAWTRSDNSLWEEFATQSVRLLREQISSVPTAQSVRTSGSQVGGRVLPQAPSLQRAASGSKPANAGSIQAIPATSWAALVSRSSLSAGSAVSSAYNDQKGERFVSTPALKRVSSSEKRASLVASPDHPEFIVPPAIVAEFRRLAPDAVLELAERLISCADYLRFAVAPLLSAGLSLRFEESSPMHRERLPPYSRPVSVHDALAIAGFLYRLSAIICPRDLLCQLMYAEFQWHVLCDSTAAADTFHICWQLVLDIISQDGSGTGDMLPISQQPTWLVALALLVLADFCQCTPTSTFQFVESKASSLKGVFKTKEAPQTLIGIAAAVILRAESKVAGGNRAHQRSVGAIPELKLASSLGSAADFADSAESDDASQRSAASAGPPLLHRRWCRFSLSREACFCRKSAWDDTFALQRLFPRELSTRNLDQLVQPAVGPATSPLPPDLLEQVLPIVVSVLRRHPFYAEARITTSVVHVLPSSALRTEPFVLFRDCTLEAFVAGAAGASSAATFAIHSEDKGLPSQSNQLSAPHVDQDIAELLDASADARARGMSVDEDHHSRIDVFSIRFNSEAPS